MSQVEFFELGLDYPNRYSELIGKVSREEVQRVAKQFLQPDTLISVVVGKQNKIADK